MRLFENCILLLLSDISGKSFGFVNISFVGNSSTLKIFKYELLVSICTISFILELP